MKRILLRVLLGAAALLLVTIAGIVVLGKLETRRVEAQAPVLAAADAARVDSEALMRDAAWLADPERTGRAAGTAGNAAAREWLIERFAETGLQPAGADGWSQPFAYERDEENLTGINVLGMLPGREPALPAIVISAHYDHEGIKRDMLYPGADDNASGVAVLLALARHFAAHPPRHDLLFAAFDAEEDGLQGAKAFLRQPTLPQDRIGFNLNLDMVARSDDKEIFAVGTWQHPWLRPLLDAVQAESRVAILFGRDRPWWAAGWYLPWTNASDHGPFHAAGIPFLYFGVADHADYHRPTDTIDRIDPQRFDANAEAILATALRLDADFDTFPKE